LNTTQAAIRKVAAKTPMLDPEDVGSMADRYAATRGKLDGLRTLIRHRSRFYRYTGVHFGVSSDEAVRADVWGFLRGARCHKGGATKPLKPTAAMVTGVVDALRAECLVADEVEPPAWIGGGDAQRPAVAELVPVDNGVLHLPARTLLPATPALFTTDRLPVAFDPAAAPPARWLRFLAELWPDDPESITVLQRWIGYLLTRDCRLQKALLLVGPARSGKGTIAGVIGALLGPENVAGPSLVSLGETFGLAPLVGRRVAIVGDGHMAIRADRGSLAETVKLVSADDPVTVNRKHLPQQTMRLGVKLMVLANELPQFDDSSGALASRFVVLRMTNSFLGREDSGLADNLRAELPGILNWAVQGWHDLRRAGRLTQPKSASAHVAMLYNLASPMLAFVGERCETDSAYTVPKTAILDDYKRWAKRRGLPDLADSVFFRNLLAAKPGLTSSRRTGEHGQRVNCLGGIRLKAEAD
jgi:putative DNA primase/helicase